LTRKGKAGIIFRRKKPRPDTDRRRWILISKEQEHYSKALYLTELTNLLGFMSSWDRKTALEEYAAKFDAAEDTDALVEALGTPTKLAFRLAVDYVPTVSPTRQAAAMAAITDPEDILFGSEGPVASLDPSSLPLPHDDVPEFLAQASEEDEEPEPSAPKKKLRGGVLAAYLAGVLAVGLPVTVALVCVGLPFLLGGAGLAAAAVYEVSGMIRTLWLVSDYLLVIGGGLAACAVGLLLLWLGIWISAELCWLWVGKLLIPLGRRLCVEREEVTGA